MSHTCVTEYFLDQSRKVDILKTILCSTQYFQQFTEKEFEFLIILWGILVSFDCFALLDNETRKIINKEWRRI